MTNRKVRAMLMSLLGLGLVVSTTALPGCGTDDGAADAKAVDTANPGVTKAAQKEKGGFVGPKGKRLTEPGAQ